MKKEEKPKIYFDVKVECMLPATLTYRVLAENAEQAATLIDKIAPNHVKYKLQSKKSIKLMVYDSGGSIIRFIKNFFRG